MKSLKFTLKTWSKEVLGRVGLNIEDKCSELYALDKEIMGGGQCGYGEIEG